MAIITELSHELGKTRMIFTETLKNRTPLQNAITAAYRMDETTAINNLLSQALLPNDALQRIHDRATQLVAGTRQNYKKQGGLNAFLHQYDLSSEEGIALMCLAEALLRIPDTATIDKLISDKLATVDWKQHVHAHQDFFVNAATWSLFLTGKVFTPALNNSKTFASTLARLISRLGIGMVRPLVLQGMKIIGKQFVLGESIDTALKRSQKY